MFALFPAFLLAIAGRALSFNISVGGSQILQSNEILGFDFDVAPLLNCNDDCNTAQQTINACNSTDSTDDSCFCSNATVLSLFNCEQCMFTELINANERMPDFRAGSTPVLAAYVASCANFTLMANETTLTLPSTWDGPAGIFIPTGGLVFAVGAAFFLGLSSILILSNM